MVRHRSSPGTENLLLKQAVAWTCCLNSRPTAGLLHRGPRSHPPLAPAPPRVTSSRRALRSQEMRLRWLSGRQSSTRTPQHHVYPCSEGPVPTGHTAHEPCVSEVPQQSLNGREIHSTLCMAVLKTQGDYVLRSSLPAPYVPLISSQGRVFLPYGFRNAFPEGPKIKAYFLQTC